MTPPFLCLLAAAAIFRLLSSDFNKSFHRRLVNLLPRNVMQAHLRVLLAEFPDRIAEFRSRVLPFHAIHVMMNVAACACFAAALWMFPPTGMQHWDLLFVQYGSLFLLPVAFLADAFLFARMLLATFSKAAEAGGAV